VFVQYPDHPFDHAVLLRAVRCDDPNCRP
jgi:hypothetical protein